MLQVEAPISHSRRIFLQGSILIPAVACSVPALALPPDSMVTEPENRRLNLINMHTDEVLDVIYWKNGSYIDNHVGQLNYFMRDHRADKSTLMDKNLYDFLFHLYSVLDTEEPFHVLSGYRTEATNTSLREQSSMVAKRSYHVHGQAIDFYIPGVDNEFIQREARRLILGGVGYYKKAGFIHLDTGYPRHWVST